MLSLVCPRPFAASSTATTSASSSIRWTTCVMAGLLSAVIARPRSAGLAFVRVAIAGLMVCLTGPLVAGTVFIDLVEDGGGANVITATVSGSLDFTSGVDSTPGFSDYIAPENGTIGFGLSTALTRSWALGAGFAVQSATPPAASGAVFAPYGAGGFAQNVLTNVSGNPLFVFLNGLQVDRSYVSGDPLSASATLSGDFQSRGITAGTATTQFTLDGLANTLTVRSTAAVPEPSTIGLALVGLAGGLGYTSLRRRRKAEAVQHNGPQC